MKKLTGSILGIILIATLATGCGSEEKAFTPPTAPTQSVWLFDIENCSWGDEDWELKENKKWPEDAWFGYGPCFNVSTGQVPGTKMDCTWTAFDINGVVVGTHSAKYNTLNDGATVAYGPYTKWYIESTEEIVKSVETFDVECRF
jgi:hypothetical protein